MDTDAQMSMTLAVTLQETGSFISGFGDWYEQHQTKRRTLFDALERYDEYARGKSKHFDFPIDANFIYEFSDRLHFVPSVADLYWGELDVFERTASKDLIRTLLGKIQHSKKYSYDYVFFDCPPSFSILSYSVLSCCSLILIPVNPDVFAARGVRLMLEGLSVRITPWPSPPIFVFMNKAYWRGGRLSLETQRYMATVREVVSRASQEGIPIYWLEAFIPDRVDIKRAVPRATFPTEFGQFFANLWTEVERYV